jgi:arsenate reductase (thioredoxin)
MYLMTPRYRRSGVQASGPIQPLRVLFLCTHNSARSQIAEALLTTKAARVAPGRFEAGSAGSNPGSRVHPRAIEALSAQGIDWRGRPKSIDAVAGQQWDLILTVCDRARESCPVFPGRPAFAHWGMDDPSEVEGDEAQRRAFREALAYLSRRIDLLLALPVDRLERMALEKRAQQIADLVPVGRIAPTRDQ